MDNFNLNNSENEYGDDRIPSLEEMAELVRKICEEARSMEDPYNDPSLIGPIAQFDIDDTLALHHSKANIMFDWGHDSYARLYVQRVEELSKLYDDILDRCYEFSN